MRTKVVRLFDQIHGVEGDLHPPPPAVGQGGEDLEVAAPGEARVQAGRLDEGADTGDHPGKLMGDLGAQETAAARRRSRQSKQASDRAGLARAVGPDEAEYAARRHVEVQPVDGPHPVAVAAAVLLAESPDLESRRGHGVSLG